MRENNQPLLEPWESRVWAKGAGDKTSSKQIMGENFERAPQNAAENLLTLSPNVQRDERREKPFAKLVFTCVSVEFRGYSKISQT